MIEVRARATCSKACGAVHEYWTTMTVENNEESDTFGVRLRAELEIVKPPDWAIFHSSYAPAIYCPACVAQMPDHERYGLRF